MYETVSISTCMSLCECGLCSFEACVDQVNCHLGFLYVYRCSVFIYIELIITEGIMILEMIRLGITKKVWSHLISAIFIAAL